MQIKKVKPKMGFIYLAKHGLNKHGLKTKNWSHLVGDQTVEGERGERRRREKKKRKRKREEEKRKKMKDQKGMELHEILKFCMNFHALMVISLFPNLGFCWDFFLTLEFLKASLVKP